MTTSRTYAGHTLDALLALANAATKGPWHGDPAGYCEYIWGPNNEMVFQIRGAGADLPMEANRDFAIAAREAVPALIERIRELEKENNELGMRDVVLRSDYESVVLDRDDLRRLTRKEIGPRRQGRKRT